MKKHTDVKERIINHPHQVRSILFRQRMQLIARKLVEKIEDTQKLRKELFYCPESEP